MKSPNTEPNKSQAHEAPVKRYRVKFSKPGLVMALFVGPALAICLLDGINWTPYVTNVRHPVEQTVPFSHKHHVNMGIDCRFCHSFVEQDKVAGIPPTLTCMNCHSQVWKDSPMLQPVRDSWQTGESLQWTKVHDLPDFVYFNHSIHIKKGIGCSTCHGRVDKMPLVWKENTLNMGWCTDCHRAPEKYIRPRDQVFNMAYEPPSNQLELGEKLVKEYNVDKKNNNLAQCSKCHR